MRPLSGDFIPATELIVSNRFGESLLVYLPEMTNAPAQGVRFFVAEDGSTVFVPAEASEMPDLKQPTLTGLGVARESAGQVLPIPGRWPLQQRRAVGMQSLSLRTPEFSEGG